MRAAMESVLRQTVTDLELIIADDASDDASCEIIRESAQSDPRVTLLTTPANRGPAAARNRALSAARGEWIAIVDSDDIIHPHRLARMLDAARREGADIVADDMVPFGDSPGIGGGTMFAGHAKGAVCRVDAAGFVRTEGSRTEASLGYCKPLIHRRAMDGLRYDETIGIGEDFDFYLRILMRGHGLLLWPEPTYLYRRHAASLSHRLSVDHLERQIAAHDLLAAQVPQEGMADLTDALAVRRQGLARALEFEHLVAALKARQMAIAVRILARKPALVANLGKSMAERMQRKTSGAGGRAARVQKVWLVAAGTAGPREKDATVLTVPEIPQDAPATAHADLAGMLAALYESGPLDVTVRGVAALHGLGYLPDARRISVELLPGEVVPDLASLPKLDAVKTLSEV